MLNGYSEILSFVKVKIFRNYPTQCGNFGHGEGYFGNTNLRPQNDYKKRFNEYSYYKNCVNLLQRMKKILKNSQNKQILRKVSSYHST